MMYYNAKARASAIDDIRKCIDVLGNVKNSELSYLDYRAITKYLNMLINEIEKEGKKKKMMYKSFTIQYYGSGVYIYGTSGIVRNFPTVQEAIEYINNLNG